MGFRMRQIERTAEHMAQLVMQRHLDRTETGAAQPRPVERVPPGRLVRWCHHDPRQGMPKRGNALFSHQRYHGIRSGRIERFDRVSNCIHSARS